MPFDQNTHNGYAITLAIQIFSIVIVGGYICLVNIFFFAICWYVEALIEDLASSFQRIDETLSHQQIAAPTTRDDLIKFLHFHIMIIR